MNGRASAGQRRWRAGLRVALAMSLWCPSSALLASPAAPPADTAARTPAGHPLERRMRACTPCHGKEGRASSGGYRPRIAGKPAGYLFEQLVAFREGRRHNPAMAHLVEHMSDGYLREIAAYFASLELPYAPPQTPMPGAAHRQRAERLVREGDPARELPPCAQCHGQRLSGVLPAVPGLVGLPRDYLLGQFGAWRLGLRRSAEPDCMATIVRRLQPDEIEALAQWISAQPTSGDMSPAPANTASAPAVVTPGAGPARTSPLRCGSGRP